MGNSVEPAKIKVVPYHLTVTSGTGRRHFKMEAEDGGITEAFCRAVQTDNNLPDGEDDFGFLNFTVNKDGTKATWSCRDSR